MQVNIISNQGAVWNGQAKLLVASSDQGEVGILPGHTPFLSLLKPGSIIVRLENNESRYFFVNGGILEVQPEIVTVLADSCLRTESLNMAAVVEAKNRVEEELRNKDGSLDYAKAQAELLELARQIQSIERLRDHK